MKNTYNVLITEGKDYDNKFENREVKFARVIFADETEYTVFENKTYGENKVKSEWVNVATDQEYPGIIDVNPTSTFAEFSNFEISKNREEWTPVKDLVIEK